MILTGLLSRCLSQLQFIWKTHHRAPWEAQIPKTPAFSQVWANSQMQLLRDLPRGRVSFRELYMKHHEKSLCHKLISDPRHTTSKLENASLSRKLGKYRTVLSLLLLHFILVSFVVLKAIN